MMHHLLNVNLANYALLRMGDRFLVPTRKVLLVQLVGRLGVLLGILSV